MTRSSRQRVASVHAARSLNSSCADLGPSSSSSAPAPRSRSLRCATRLRASEGCALVAEAKVWVDVEDAVREWARDNVLTAARRVFFAVNNDINEPQIVVQRIAGPDDACIVQFDVWARTKVAAAALAAELATQAEALSRYINDGVLL